MKKLITIMLLLFLFMNTNAQNADKKWGLGIYAGKTEYSGDLGNGFLDFDQDFNLYGALSLNRYISKTVDLGIQGSYGNYGYFKNSILNFKGKKADGELLLYLKLNNDYIFNADAILAPYFVTGAGMAYMWDEAGSGSNIGTGYDFIYSGGAGLKLNITNWMALQYQMLYHFTFEDKRDLYPYPSKRDDGYMAHSVGLVFSFGAPKDTDKDGIPDKSDKCANTPSDVKVDANGCPLDTDGDGIADYLDKCPGIAGIAAFQGCPDTDGDGIQDINDKCPNTPANVKVDANGCPLDTDNDGVADYLDKCPNQKGLAGFDGCPDTDGDGIIDSEDKCPNEKGTKEMNGCPDRDNDGVADIDDKCPDIAGIKENKGCPEVKAAAKETFRKALQGIQFATGKDVLLKTSFPILNQIVEIMKENPTYKLQINGHTDNVGDDANNLILSEKRSAAVKTYLLKKGVENDRLQTAGYGETKPVADNNTTLGKKQNRRVEFIVEF